MPKLSIEFYNQSTLKVAKLLLGKFLIRKLNGKKLIGKIVETEGYSGPKDLASHASRGKTPRNEIMFGPPGHAYIYLIYGINYCFNLVTEKESYPAAVLIRALEPKEGIEEMKKRRKMKNNLPYTLTNGPGKLCQAFGIDKGLNKINVTQGTLWVEDSGEKIKPQNIVAAKRIGVDYAREYKDKLWRFYIKNNKFVSKY